jgi:hypothetical protein
MPLTKEEITGLANASPKFAQMMKIAADNMSNFNEDVPATQNGNNPSSSSYPSNSSPAGENQNEQGAQPEVSTGEEEYAAVPEEEGMMPEKGMQADTPESVGARAAQAFLGPIMDAAMQGDPSAQDIVSRAAGHVAGSTAEAYLRSSQGGQQGGMMPGMEQGMGQEMQPPAITSPEEDLANEIVGDSQQQAPQQQPAQEGGAPKKEEE